VLVPMAVMRPIAGYTLAAGIPTLMEKPPGCNTQETRELLEIAKRYGTPHQVAVNRRYAPLLQRMKQLLGEAGPISGLSCQFYRVGRTEDHFGFGTGLHGLDAMCYLADSRVVGLETCIGPRDSAMAMLHLASGARASFEMFPQVGLQSERYTAHAGERTVIVDGCIGWLTHFPGFVECYERGHLVLREETDAHMPVEEVSGFYGESAAFVAALVTGSRPGPDLTVALRSVEMAEAVNAGADIAFS